MKRGKFIVLEGPDKSGKSTQCALLVKYLKKRKIDFVFVREPGGGKIPEAIRKILLNPGHKITALAELFLYEASRAQLTEETIKPALESGKLVLCDRYALSSIAYQGYGRGIDLSIVKRLNDIATGGLKPDLALVFNAGEKLFSARAKGRKADRLELENAKFRRRVLNGYLKEACKTPNTFVIGADKPIEEVFSQAVLRINKVLGIK